MDGSSKIWSAVVVVGKKKVKLLLYADSFDNATEIVKDYVELHYSGSCKFAQLKEYGEYIVIEEALSKEDADSDKEKKLYKMAVNIQEDEYEYSNNFLVFATDVESSKTAINYWMSNELKENNNDADFSTTVESAVIISFSAIIDRAFSQVYMDNNKTEEDGSN